MSTRLTRATLGIRDHSGWAVLVALSGDPGNPRIIERRRISLLSPGMPSEPYHAVAGQSAELARTQVRESYEGALECARHELTAAITDLAAHGHGVTAAGCGVSASPVTVPLERVLKAHPLLHASEGELFRDAVAEAAESLGLAVSRVPWKEVWAQLDAELGAGARDRVYALGATLGPPWTADHKEAAAAAWLALAHVVRDA